MQKRIGRELAIDVTAMAIEQRQIQTDLLHHSDRGRRYTSDDFQSLLSDHGIQCSKSRRGNGWDNAFLKSFFAMLKKERVCRRRCRARSEARADLLDYIEVFYNRKRPHSLL